MKTKKKLSIDFQDQNYLLLKNYSDENNLPIGRIINELVEDFFRNGKATFFMNITEGLRHIQTELDISNLADMIMIKSGEECRLDERYADTPKTVLRALLAFYIHNEDIPANRSYDDFRTLLHETNSPALLTARLNDLKDKAGMGYYGYKQFTMIKDAPPDIISEALSSIDKVL